MDAACRTLLMARRKSSRRAISLIELAAVGAILALVTLAGISRFGHNTLANAGAEGFVRQLSLALAHARRSTIATGDNHFLQLSPASGDVTEFTLMRRTGSGDIMVDETRSVPQDVTVTSAQRDLEFDFDGTALAAYAISIIGPNRSWDLSVVPLTGAVESIETTP